MKRKTQNIGSICKLMNGNGFKPSEWKKEGLPIIRIQNLNGINTFNYFDGKPDPRWLINTGDLLFAWAGVKGVSFGPAIWGGQKGVLNQHIFKVELTGDIDKKWLFYILKVVTKKIEMKAHGFKRSLLHVQKHDITNTKVPIITLKDQRAIVQVLENWDSAIEKTERLIAAKKQRMRSLLEALILRPSNHWKSYSLSDVCGPVTRKNTVGETNVLTSSAEYGLISQLEYYKKNVSASDVTGYYLLHKGEFAYNRSAAKGYPYGAIKRLENYTQGVLSTLYLCFSVSSEAVCDPVFLAHYFESGVLNRALSEVCQEGARSHGLLNITKADFFDLPIALPSIDSQKKIAEGLSVAAEEIELMAKQKNLYEKQKSFLMSKLLSGEWEAPSSAFEEAVE